MTKRIEFSKIITEQMNNNGNIKSITQECTPQLFNEAGW